ncbi:hypothetical protein [Vibrio phage phiKT1028]|nr:hypothetical protein [Vibrio phage phiKT1028]
MNNETPPAHFVTVIFSHLLPENEYVSHEMYERALAILLTDIFMFGSYQPTIIAKSVETVMNEIEGQDDFVTYTYAYDQVYGDLGSFLEDVLYSPINAEPLSSLMSLHGTGDVYAIQHCSFNTSIILLVTPQPARKFAHLIVPNKDQ